jgi:hypothetical protein
VSDDLPRIGPEPDCQFPGCQLLGRTRTRTPAGNEKIVCSLHVGWPLCEATWEWDVFFEVGCELTPRHHEFHRAHVEGADGTLATIIWKAGP